MHTARTQNTDLTVVKNSNLMQDCYTNCSKHSPKLICYYLLRACNFDCFCRSQISECVLVTEPEYKLIFLNFPYVYFQNDLQNSVQYRLCFSLEYPCFPKQIAVTQLRVLSQVKLRLKKGRVVTCCMIRPISHSGATTNEQQAWDE